MSESLYDLLCQIGLSDGEAKVYLALLTLGSVPVNKIKEETRLHRTTIYDFLEKLLNKGLVSYVVKNGVNFYQAAHPNKLLDFIKEKEGLVQQALPKLAAISQLPKEEVHVEVYRGPEALKSVLNDVLRLGKDYVIFGVDETMFKGKFGSFMEQFFAKEKRLKFHERILTSDDAKFVYDKPTTHYRFISRRYFNPTPTYVWGDNVAMLIWDPLTVIRIKNPKLADSYLKYFEILWSIAEDRPRSKWPKGK
jgi:sugar-specific transcriptional regulator TrmB